MLTVLLIAVRYRRAFWRSDPLAGEPERARPHVPLVTKALLVSLLMMTAFFLGTPPAKAALLADGFLLLTRSVKPEKVYREIDWPLLLMFAGLLVVVAGLERAVRSREDVRAVAMASTLAGNLTILGSVANLIVVQRAAARGIVIGFVEHLAVGAPLTVLTILFGSWWLA